MSKSSHNGLIWLIIFIILIGFFVATCPSIDDHKSQLKNISTAALNEKLSEENEVTNALGGMIGGYFIDKIVDNQLLVKNYFVCSIGYMRDNEENQIVSVGILGHVFSSSKDDMLKNMKDF